MASKPKYSVELEKKCQRKKKVICLLYFLVQIIFPQKSVRYLQWEIDNVRR